MTEDEREAHEERIAICVESGVPEDEARRIADEQIRRQRDRHLVGLNGCRRHREATNTEHLQRDDVRRD